MREDLIQQKNNSSKWFKELRNQMVGSIEKIEGKKFEEKNYNILKLHGYYVR